MQNNGQPEPATSDTQNGRSPLKEENSKDFVEKNAIESNSAGKDHEQQPGKTSDQNGEPVTAEPRKLSKNARKRIEKARIREETREEHRRIKRTKKQAKKQAKKATKRAVEDDGAVSIQKQPKKKARKADVASGCQVILDCSFDDLMTEKEIISLGSQLTRCYADNRTAEKPMGLKICSFNKRLRHRMEVVLGGQCRRWTGVDFLEEAYSIEDPSRMVYLTSEATDVINVLDENHIYIIGGLVDRNRHKGICFEKAQSQGIKTAKLPIGDYMKMASRHVLTTNQVLEIMLYYRQSNNWLEAFKTAIPSRKMPAFNKEASPASLHEENASE